MSAGWCSEITALVNLDMASQPRIKRDKDDLQFMDHLSLQAKSVGSKASFAHSLPRGINAQKPRWHGLPTCGAANSLGEPTQIDLEPL